EFRRVLFRSAPSATESPRGAMADFFLLAILVELGVGHAPKVIPPLIVLSGVRGTEMPKLVGVLAALRRAMEPGAFASYMITGALFRLTRLRRRVRLLDADVDELGAVGERL